MTTAPDQPRQRLRIVHHYNADPQPTWYVAPIEPPTAQVDVMDGLALQSSDPAILRSLAAAFTGAADDLEATLKVEVGVGVSVAPAGVAS